MLLYAYPPLQVLLIVGVFPMLFIAAESGVLEAELAATIGAALPPEPRRESRTGRGCFGAHHRGLIDYGDIAPLTKSGDVQRGDAGRAG